MEKNEYLFIFTKNSNLDKETNYEEFGLSTVNQEYRTAVLFPHDVVSYIMHYRERNPKWNCTSVSIIRNCERN